MLATTDAIVLKSMKYRDTSRIVTVYTREYGKLSVIAKGARGPKSKFASALDPLSRVVLVFYRKEHRDLHLVSQCDLRTSYRVLTGELERMAAALACLELIDQTTHDEERNDDLFRLIEHVLEALDAERAKPEVLLAAFKLRMAAAIGFATTLDDCAVCGRSFLDGSCEAGWFRLASGSVACTECQSRVRAASMTGPSEAAGLMRLSVRTHAALAQCATGPLSALATTDWTAAEGNEIHNATRLYLHHHIEHLRPLKSEELLFRPVVRSSTRRS